MPIRPLISVLLPTWNDLPFLPAAVHSILGQTFTDFELVIVDDASSDTTSRYLQTVRDARIRVLRNPTNLGVTDALNRGLETCDGIYIARMDADDVAEPDRLAAQFALLETDHDIGIVGSSRTLINEAGESIGTAPAMPDDLAIRWKCLLGNPLPHPTVMMRSELLQRHGLRYNATFRSAQDYELWSRLLCVTKAANITRPLLKYRIRASSISQWRKAEQQQNHDQIALLANQRLLPSFPLNPMQINNLRGRYGGASVRDLSMAQCDREWLDLLSAMLKAFATMHHDRQGLQPCLADQRRWIDAFKENSATGPQSMASRAPISARPLN